MLGATSGRTVLLCLVAAACGGGGVGPTSPSPPPNNPHRITIGSTGAVSPAELVVPPGTRVLFVNSHSRRHDMTSDPHPEHTACPEINQVGVLNPGQSRETGNLVAVRTCGFHDHDDPDNSELKGRIVIR
jgi:plastocyanin